MTKKPKKRGLWRFFPDSLHGQLVLALLIGIPALQAINIYAVISIQDNYVRQAEESRAETITTYYFLLNKMTPEQRADVVSRVNSMRRSQELPEALELFTQLPDWEVDATWQDSREAALLRKSLFTGQGNKNQAGVRIYNSGELHAPSGVYTVKTAIPLHDGSWMAVLHSEQSHKKFNIWMKRSLLIIEAAVMTMLIIALLQRLNRPLRQLGLAVEDFGRHPEASTPLPVKGTSEIREVAQSFNHMRSIICRNITERKHMLAAMAHDLRTPLTRAQLRLEKVQPEELRQKLKANILEVQSIINQGLELAESLNTTEEYIPLNLESFIQSIVDDSADLNGSVRFHPPSGAAPAPTIVMARPMCLRRCVDNLISNAVKYGGNAEVRIRADKESAAIEILDSGPGIPEDLLEQVFEPYFRLETSRNRSYGGIGLGLSIARNMALLNDGNLTLSNRREGGLSASVSLPLRRCIK